MCAPDAYTYRYTHRIVRQGGAVTYKDFKKYGPCAVVSGKRKADDATSQLHRYALNCDPSFLPRSGPIIAAARTAEAHAREQNASDPAHLHGGVQCDHWVKDTSIGSQLREAWLPIHDFDLPENPTTGAHACINQCCQMKHCQALAQVLVQWFVGFVLAIA